MRGRARAAATARSSPRWPRRRDSRTRAAQRPRHLTQSTVSETLSALERTLGVSACFRKASQRRGADGRRARSRRRYARRMSAIDQRAGRSARAAPQPTSRPRWSSPPVQSVGAHHVLPSRLAAPARARWPSGARGGAHRAAPRFATVSQRAKRCRPRARAGDGPKVGGPGECAAIRVWASRPTLPPRRTPDRLSPAISTCVRCGETTIRLRRLFRGPGPAPVQAIGTIEGVGRAILARGTALGLIAGARREPELRDGVLTEVRVRPSALRGAASPCSRRARLVQRWSTTCWTACAARPGTGRRLTAAMEDAQRHP